MDWRAYQETHGLTEKQQKLATKVRKRELRIANLQTEMERIKVPPGGSASLVSALKLRLPLRLSVPACFSCQVVKCRLDTSPSGYAH